MELPLYNQEGASLGTVQLSNGLFGVPMNQDLLHQVVTSQMANQRRTLAHTKDRGEVRGGGKKPWRQKGTGRARHGSIRSPLWKGGGTTFGPRKDKIFKKKINRAMARKALAVALSAKVADKQMLLLDEVKLEQPKTKQALRVVRNLAALFAAGSARQAYPRTLFVLPAGTGRDPVVRAFRNLPDIELTTAASLNALTTLSFKQLVITRAAAEALQTLGAGRASSAAPLK